MQNVETMLWGGVSLADSQGYVLLGKHPKKLRDLPELFFSQKYISWTIGKNGFLLCLNDDNQRILFNGFSSDGQKKYLSDIGGDINVLRQAAPGTVFSMRLYGRHSFCIYGNFNGLIFMAAVPDSLAGMYWGKPLWISTAVLGILFVISIFVSARLSILGVRLNQSIETDRKNKEADFLVASTVQASTLPLPFPDRPDVKISTRMKMAREVGGDFYDYYVLPNGRIIFLIADVAGKGIPAALFMMKAKSIISLCISRYKRLAEAITMANREIARNNQANLFVTAWVGCLDPATGAVEYVNAGHNPPLLKHGEAGSGDVQWLTCTPQLVLGVDEGTVYSSQRLNMAVGDCILLYTDGVIDAVNPTGQFYGEQRLEKTLAGTDARNVDSIYQDIADFSGEAELNDDMAMMSLCFVQKKEE